MTTADISWLLVDETVAPPAALTAQVSWFQIEEAPPPVGPTAQVSWFQIEGEPVETAPAAPTLVSSDGTSESTATTTWVDNSNNEVGFDVEIASLLAPSVWVPAVGAANPTLPGVQTFSHTGLPGAADFRVRVRARGTLVNSAWVVGNDFGTDNAGVGTTPIPTPVATVPVITTPLVNLTAVAGAVATFVVAATGTAPLSFQWSFKGVDIAGATNASYARTTTIEDDGGAVSVRVGNVAGVATSNAVLTVTPTPVAPQVTTQPASQSAVDGGTFTFSSAASGTPTPTVKWQISSDGVAWSDIAGATSPAYVRGASFVDGGKRVRSVWSNGVSPDANSSPALLTVTAVTSPPAVTLQPVAQSVIEGETVTLIAAFSGTPTPTLQWRRAQGGVTTDIAGATSGTLSFAAAAADNGAVYSCRALNSAGEVVSSAVTLTVAPLVAPSITAQPSSTVSSAGSVAQFTGAVTGSLPISIQWQRNGEDIAGATALPLLYTVQPGDQGAVFTFTASNAGGSVTSADAVLTLVAALPAVLSLARQYRVNPDRHLDAYSIERGNALFWEKDPNAILDYSIDWTDWVADVPGDSIVTLVVAKTDGVSVPAQGVRGSITAVMAGGGDDGSDEEITMSIVTAQGRADDRTVKLRIRQR